MHGGLLKFHGGSLDLGQAGRELGFLPGDLGDKMAPWAKPIIDNLDFIMRRLHGYLRGRSIHDAAIIVDDGQNLTQEDMKLVLTRAGEGSRVILTGDPDQIDREDVDSLSNGLVQVVERFKGQSCFAHLTMQEVVRSRIAEMAARLL